MGVTSSASFLRSLPILLVPPGEILGGSSCPPPAALRPARPHAPCAAPYGLLGASATNQAWGRCGSAAGHTGPQSFSGPSQSSPVPAPGAPGATGGGVLVLWKVKR